MISLLDRKLYYNKFYLIWFTLKLWTANLKYTSMQSNSNIIFFILYGVTSKIGLEQYVESNNISFYFI